MDTKQFQAGRERLAHPILPLVRLVQLLFLTGPFAKVSEVLAELNEPIDTVVRYEEPAAALSPYLDLLEEFARLKEPSQVPYTVHSQNGEALSLFEAVDGWVAQQVLSRELEAINSLLCGPCRCTLCCVGPDSGMRQNFFEIPLQPEEIGRFPLSRIDTPESRSLTSDSEPGLAPQGRLFHEQGPGLYHWRTGWSMILPRASACPHLAADGACAIYPQRPDVCRRPQIFAYLLEAAAGQPSAFVLQNKILAIWDCPYVRELQTEIATYAELCELEPIFKENKA